MLRTCFPALSSVTVRKNEGPTTGETRCAASPYVVPLIVHARFGRYVCDVLRLSGPALAAVLCFARLARADCPAGYYPCGVSHCTPEGGVCCASVGREDTYCPSGETCNSDGTCSSGGGGSCPAGYEQCGVSHCTPSGDVCCAYAGHEEGYCPAGETCNTNGTCASGSSAGGGCSPGYFGCGTSHCTPNGAVCCAYVGHEEGYCPAGTTCNADGTCSGGGGTTSGGGGCGGGQVTCGSSHCVPDSAVCCAYAGHEELYCPSGETCNANGTCSMASGSGGSGGGSGGYGGGSGSYGGGYGADPVRWGCNASGGASVFAWLLPMLLPRRRRSSRR
jgi:hypothetical protein